MLLTEEDNINRSIKVRGELYTALAKEGRFLTREKPFGYSKVGKGKQRHLEVNEIEVKVVKNIYDMFLRDVPSYKIKEIAYGARFDRKGTMAIDRVLQILFIKDLSELNLSRICREVFFLLFMNR